MDTSLELLVRYERCKLAWSEAVLGGEPSADAAELELDHCVRLLMAACWHSGAASGYDEAVDGGDPVSQAYNAARRLLPLPEDGALNGADR